MDLKREPLTPRVPFFLRPELNTTTFCIIGFEHPIDMDALKSFISSSPMVQLQRFCSLVVVDDKNGTVRGWKKIQTVDMERHVIAVRENLAVGDQSEADAVNQYVADLSVNHSFPLDKPLWEIHVLVAHRCMVLWAHHAVGDGVSFMSLLQVCFGTKAHEKNSLLQIQSDGMRKGRRGNWVMKRIGSLWFDVKFLSGCLVKSLLVGDRKTAISGGAGVELWPRKLVTATFRIDDMKLVKRAVPNATINDVFFTVVSCGIGRYLEHRSGKGLAKGLRITGVCLVNVREKPGLLDLSEMLNPNSASRWGNKFGIFLLPVRCHEASTNPLEYLRKARVMLHRKKRSVEAYFSYKFTNVVVSLLGAKCGSRLAYKMLSNTTFTISNMVGPREELAVAGNPVTYLKGSISSTPQALEIHMLSYGGKANLQILVAKDVIPDAEFLASCFENALLELKQAALSNEGGSK